MRCLGSCWLAARTRLLALLASGCSRPVCLPFGCCSGPVACNAHRIEKDPISDSCFPCFLSFPHKSCVTIHRSNRPCRASSCSELSQGGLPELFLGPARELREDVVPLLFRSRVDLLDQGESSVDIQLVDDAVEELPTFRRRQLRPDDCTL